MRIDKAQLNGNIITGIQVHSWDADFTDAAETAGSFQRIDPFSTAARIKSLGCARRVFSGRIIRLIR
jgi:hypothetical protein